MYEDPSFVAGIDELVGDLHLGIAAGTIPDHDVELMAAAMVGSAIQVGIALLGNGEPPTVERVDAAATFLSTVFIAGLRAVGRPVPES
jgi:hypothetical protein